MFCTFYACILAPEILRKLLLETESSPRIDCIEKHSIGVQTNFDDDDSGGGSGSSSSSNSGDGNSRYTDGERGECGEEEREESVRSMGSPPPYRNVSTMTTYLLVDVSRLLRTSL